MCYYPLSGFWRISVVEVRERMTYCVSIVFMGSWPLESKKKVTEVLKKVEIGNNRVLLYKQLFSPGYFSSWGCWAVWESCCHTRVLHLSPYPLTIIKKPQSFKWDVTLPLLSGYVPNEQSYFTQVAHSSGRVSDLYLGYSLLIMGTFTEIGDISLTFFPGPSMLRCYVDNAVFWYKCSEIKL